MDKLNVIAGVSFSIPPGITQAEKEEFYEIEFKSFITALYNYSEIKITLYLSGGILEWLEEKHREAFMVLVELFKEKRIEILGGAYNEPLLPLINNHECSGQIEEMSNLLVKEFGKKPKGFWLDRFIWSDFVIPSLITNGMSYTFLPDRAFLKAGVEKRDLYQPVLTDDQGKKILVFPLDSSIEEVFYNGTQNMQKDILSKTFADKREIVAFFLDIASLRRIHNKPASAEKFWDRVLGMILFYAGKQSLVTPSEWIKKQGERTFSRVYFSTSTFSDVYNSRSNDNKSYRFSMMKYREAAYLYSKMNYVQLLTSQIRGDKSKKNTVKRYLWRGQNLHGYKAVSKSSRGLFDIENRHYCYTNLLDAEKESRSKGSLRSRIAIMDFDVDGCDEYLYIGQYINAYLHKIGGALFELDYLPESFNFANILSSDENLTRGDYYKGRDYPGKMFLDHIFPYKEKIKNLPSLYENNISDFPYRHYEVLSCHKEKCVVELFCQNKKYSINKKYIYKRNGIELVYNLTNLSSSQRKITFVPEINMALNPVENLNLLYWSRDRFLEIKSLKKRQGVNISTSILNIIHNGQTSIKLILEEEIDVTIFKSEENIDGKLSYQGHVILPQWDFILSAGENKEFKVELKITKAR